jgi:hypothetical protein
MQGVKFDTGDAQLIRELPGKGGFATASGAYDGDTLPGRRKLDCFGVTCVHQVPFGCSESMETAGDFTTVELSVHWSEVEELEKERSQTKSWTDVKYIKSLNFQYIIFLDGFWLIV